MAFPVVATKVTSATTSSSTTQTVTLPGSISAGDLLLIWLEINNGPTVTTPTDWTLLFTARMAGNRTFVAFWKSASGSEGASVNVTVSTSTRSVHCGWRITGWGGIEATSTFQASGGEADPPSHTPTGGAKDYLWIACGGGTFSSIVSYPANYTDNQVLNENQSSAFSGMVLATRNLNASSENPAAYDTNTTGNWEAATISITPAVVAPVMSSDANTIGLWHMDGTVGSAAKIDNAQGTAALDITEVSSPTSVTGVAVPTTNGAYSTTGGSAVRIPDNAALDVTNLTVEGWFKTTSSNCGLFHRYVGGANRSFRVIITAGGKMQIIMYDNADNNSTPIDSTTTVNDGGWHYFALTYDGTTIKIYVDPTNSTPQASTTFGSLAASAAPLDIGKGNPVETTNPTAQFDEWRYSNTARTGTQIYNYFNSITLGGLKTWNSIAKASVKTRNGVAIASIKTANDIT